MKTDYPYLRIKLGRHVFWNTVHLKVRTLFSSPQKSKNIYMRFLRKKCYKICTYKYLVGSSPPFDEENSINGLYHNSLKSPQQRRMLTSHFTSSPNCIHLKKASVNWSPSVNLRWICSSWMFVLWVPRTGLWNFPGKFQSPAGSDRTETRQEMENWYFGNCLFFFFFF